MASSGIVCPADGCQLSDSLVRLLEHFRCSHSPDDLPTSFASCHGLVQCSYCHQWFIRLLRHTPKCRSSVLPGGARKKSTATSGNSCRPDASSQPEVAHLSASAPLPSPITESCEDIAWSLISRLSFQDILQAQFRPTLTKIPAAVVSLFQQC